MILRTFDRDEEVETLLQEYIPHPFTLLRTPNGKPYVEGNDIYFNISHSQNFKVLALHTSPIGVDIEALKGKTSEQIRELAIFRQLSEEEKADISCEADFLRHWTMKEAFIKYHGYTIADTYKKLKIVGDTLFLDGKPQHIPHLTVLTKNYVLCIFGDDKIEN